MFEDKKKLIDGKMHWHYSLLKNWDKNNEARMITEENWNKLVASIQREGIKDPLKIDNDGVVYDGNNRVKALIQVLTMPQHHASEWVSVDIRHPKNEAEKWDIALSGNGQFAQWSQDGLSNYMPEFENELDISLYNVNFFDPKGFDEFTNPEEETTAEKQIGGNKDKSIKCPQCGHVFTPE